MPSSPCRTVDPVEILLRGIFRRASLLAGSSSLAACVVAVELDAGESARLDAAQHEVVPPLDAHFDAAAVQRQRDAGIDAQPGPPYDAGAPDAWLGDPACAPSADAGATFELTPPGPAIRCEQGGLPIRAEGLKPSETFDYLAVRLARAPIPPQFSSDDSGAPDVPPPDAGAEPWTHTLFQTLSETGRSCASATGPLCAQTVAKHPATTALSTPCFGVCLPEYSVVTTQGEDVRRWHLTEDVMRPFLGAIDSADDALLLLHASGYELRCDDARRTSIKASAGGYEAFALSYTSHCGGSWYLLSRLHISSSGAITTLESKPLEKVPCCAGRKPAGLQSEARALGRNLLGDFLASCAHLEAASVVSFERLERELSAYGAPRELIEAARSARADEVRHAAIVARLAHARGGQPVAPEVEPLAVRALEEIALENVVEGCVRETYAALVASYQAVHARDRELRDAMVEIAEDELRHAILAHRVERWIAGKLDAAALARIAEAKRRAVRELARDAALPIADELERSAGLPSGVVARALVNELAQSLWARVAGDGKRCATC